MPTNSQYSTTEQNAIMNALLALLAGAILRIYDGTQPANANTAITTQNKLAELTLPTPGGTQSNGVITVGTIAAVAALLTGTATWFRLLEADGVTVLCDGSVGTSGANLNLNSVAIQQNAQVQVTSLSLTGAAAGT